MLLKIMEKTKYQELAQEAALHGVKLKPEMQSIDMSDKDRSAYDKQAQSAFERLKARHKMRGT